MKITLSPTRMDAKLSLRREDDALFINEIPLDLGTYETGDSNWIIGQPERDGGIWQVTVVFPHAADAPKELLFPAPLTVTENGPIILPQAFETDAQDTTDLSDL